MTTAFSFPYFMSHPFWRFLRISEENKSFDFLPFLSETERNKYLTIILEGFYPISYSSALGFKKFSELADHPESSNIARTIYEVEMGIHPLILGSKFSGVLHCNQLKALMESLAGASLLTHQPHDYEVIEQVGFEEMNLTQAMAVCDVIETTAPHVIHFYQDFTAQYQCYFCLSSEQVERTYLDEHNLTEGADCEEQHVEMLGKMKAPYSVLEQSAAYNEAKNDFIWECNQHFSQCEQKLLDIIAVNTASSALSEESPVLTVN